MELVANGGSRCRKYRLVLNNSQYTERKWRQISCTYHPGEKHGKAQASHDEGYLYATDSRLRSG